MDRAYCNTGKERTVKILAEWRPIALSRIGRPRLRWEDDVREFLGKMKTQYWSKMAMGREAWKKIFEQAKIHTGL
jgi:hypothetical protein